MSNPNENNVFVPEFNETISCYYNNKQTSAIIDYNGLEQTEQCLKETGIIEKMLTTYGFIQCCDRTARLFFHFSTYIGNISQLKIGDPVEYETSYDKRTGKPVAINIKKIASDDMSNLFESERLSGSIATELTNNSDGRIAFENHGEFFFPPFSKEDVVNDQHLKANDKVTFLLITDHSGNYRATNVQLEQSSEPAMVYIQGVISNIKGTFGFIERSDNNTKIFFHSSDCEDFKTLNVGDLVQFNITSRKNKELAINVIKTANVEEEISEKRFKGQIVKYNSKYNITFGFIDCSDYDSNSEYDLRKQFFFSDNDFLAKHTIKCMDMVSFQIATDRRTSYQRATNIVFLQETFNINGEVRSKGYVAYLEETHGKIKCPSIEGSLIYFKQTELLDSSITLKLNEELEFTLVASDNTRPEQMNQMRKCQAIRISTLPNGTIFKSVLFSKKPLNNHNSGSNQAALLPNGNGFEDANINANGNATAEENLIDFNIDINELDFKSNANFYHMGNVEHYKNNQQINNNHNNNWKDLMQIFIANDAELDDSDDVAGRKEGYIVVLKDNYGFIESVDGEIDYYFNTSSFKSDMSTCLIGQSVSFNPVLINNKWKALNVRVETNIKQYDDDICQELLTGKVIRTLQMFNNEQLHYTGLIEKQNTVNGFVHNTSLKQIHFEFSMISLKFFKDYISVGDSVKFQVATNPVTKKKRAYNVQVIRERSKGTILNMQEKFGFLKPDHVHVSRNIYFNLSDVRSNANIKTNDKVDFYLIKNEKTEKLYAIDIDKLEHSACNIANGSTTTTATDRTFLKNFIKSNNENGPKVVVIRQPRAPDGSRGFTNL